MNKNTILIRSENATFQVVEGEAILIRMDTGNYYSLNKVATLFWEMLDGEATIADIAASIARRYSASSAEFVSELRSLAEKPAAERDTQGADLAERYGVEPAAVSQSLPLLAGADAKSHAADLIAAHGVSAESVTDDLLDLAKELDSEELVEVVDR